MQILVTGGSGYIGSHLIVEALKAGHTIISIDISGSLLNRNENLHAFTGSILDVSLLDRIASHFQIDAIIHLAAEKSISKSENSKTLFMETNVTGTEILAHFALKYEIKYFVFASTAAVYEDTNGKSIVSEESDIKPSSFYGETKMRSENFLISEFAKRDIKLSLLRLFNVAGASHAYKPFHYDVNIFPQIIKSIHCKEFFKLYGNNFSTYDGSCVRDYIHVQDVSKIMLKMLSDIRVSSRLNILNVCSSIGVSNLEVIREIERISNIQVKVTICPRRNGEIGQVIGDNRKLVSLFPEIEFQNLNLIAQSAWKAYEALNV